MARLRWVRPTIVGTAVLACVAAIGFFGARGGYPATHPRPSARSARPAPSPVGQPTLPGGSPAQVAAPGHGGPPPDRPGAGHPGPPADAGHPHTRTPRP